MEKQKIWIFSLCLLTVALLTESVLPEHKTYITDALAQNAFIIKTWTYRDSTFFLTVTKENKTLLSAFFDGVSAKEQDNRLSIKYNNITKEVSLLLNNISRNDEGLYQISTSIYRTAAEDSEIMENTWNLQLNILEPGEIKHGYAGENIVITEFVQESIFCPRLYHNNQLIAVLRGSHCDTGTNSPFYGRIRCSNDKDNNKTRIEITNITENDTGLYKVETERSLTQRFFLNITVPYTNSANALKFITPPERSHGVNSEQPRNNTLPPTVLVSTAVNRANLLSVPIYVIPVIIGAVGIIQFIGCLVWSQWRKINMTKAAEQSIPQVECDPHLYLTPIAHGIPLPVPTTEDRQTGHSNIAQTTKRNSSTLSIHIAQMRSKDGYEEVDISNNDDPENKMEHEEILYESTEHCNTTFCDTSGYLTVLAARETTA